MVYGCVGLCCGDVDVMFNDESAWVWYGYDYVYGYDYDDDDVAVQGVWGLC